MLVRRQHTLNIEFVDDQKKLQVLVPGGAGFIGSHCVIELVSAGYEPIVVDNFSNSSIGNVT
jgi:nucleoside-diphosphate-sugar epimerase